ncbi:unnamed protein product [marine sediment metagenome]|uniref:Uncharacterized protein n=1 Tax=marine sediment metagenome TaxID=412755 RepID=X1S7D5_9ZZZZ
MRTFNKVFEECKQVANEKFDGHMTLYKFGKGWKFCFGTPSDLYIETVNLFYGDTPEEAMQKALQNPKYVEASDGVYQEAYELRSIGKQFKSIADSLEQITTTFGNTANFIVNDGLKIRR